MVKNIVRRLWRRIRRWTLVYWLIAHTFERHHVVSCRAKNAGYAWGWMDTDYRMLHASFNLLQQFVEEEDPFSLTTFMYHEDESAKIDDEIRDLYTWWVVDREAEINREFNTGNAQYKRDQEMFERLVKIRCHLWT